MRYLKQINSTISLIVIALLLISCSGNQVNDKVVEVHLPIGFSGLAKINSVSYLAVYDLKSFEDGSRLGVIEMNDEGGYDVKPVRFQTGNMWTEEVAIWKLFVNYHREKMNF